MDKKAAKAVRCDTCDLTLNSEQQAQQHFSGKSHAKKLKKATGGGSGGSGDSKNATQQSGNSSASESGYYDDPEVQEPMQKLDPISQAIYDNMMGKLPKKRKTVEIYCDVCDVEFNSEAQADQHFTGTKHNKKARILDVSEDLPPDAEKFKLKTGSFYCQFCDIELNSPEQLSQHRSGSSHLKKVQAQAVNPTLKPNQNPENLGEVPGLRPGWLHCNVCDISVSTAVKLNVHVGTAEHQSKFIASGP